MLKNNEQNENEIRKFKIYAHINKINGKIYIGQTCRDVNRRWANGLGYKGNNHFNNAIKKYGWDNFEHIVLFDDLSQEMANIIEEYLIKKYDTTNKKHGYNMRSGGSNLCGSDNPNYGRKHSEESKEIISKKAKIRFSNKENHPRYGACLSDAIKEKIRLGNSKKYSTERRIERLLSDKKIHKISLYDKQMTHIKTFLCVSDAKVFLGKDFRINFFKKPFYIDAKNILIFDDVYDKVIQSEDFIHAINNYGIRENQKSVICLNDLKIYKTISEAAKDKKCDVSSIIMCCKGERNCGGSDSVLGKLIWEYYDKNKIYEKKVYIRKGSNGYLDINDNSVFSSYRQATKYYDISRGIKKEWISDNTFRVKNKNKEYITFQVI